MCLKKGNEMEYFYLFTKNRINYKHLYPLFGRQADKQTSRQAHRPTEQVRMKIRKTERKKSNFSAFFDFSSPPNSAI